MFLTTMGGALLWPIDVMEMIRAMVIIGLFLYVWFIAVGIRSAIVDKDVRGVVPILMFLSTISFLNEVVSAIASLTNYHVIVDLTSLAVPAKSIITLVLGMMGTFCLGALIGIARRIEYVAGSGEAGARNRGF